MASSNRTLMMIPPLIWKRPRNFLRGFFIILLILPVATSTPAHGREIDPRIGFSTDRTAGRPGTGACVYPALRSADCAGDDTDRCAADSTDPRTGPSLFTRPLLAAISLYQKVISPQQGQVCAFQPTCSQFAQQALRTYGLVQGGLMTSDRLQRCHTCAAGYGRGVAGRAHDPVDDHILWGRPDGGPIRPAPIDAVTPARLSTPAEKTPPPTPGGPQLTHRSPLLAALFSSALPGAGKVYAGRPADGFYSLLVTGSSTWAAASYGRDEHWGRAGLFGAMGLFFYLGNIYGSAVEARRSKMIWIESPPEAADTLGYESHYQRGLSYLRGGYWQRARNELGRAARMAPSASLNRHARLRLGQSYLSEGLPQRSEDILRYLLGPSYDLETESVSAEIQYWMGVSTLQQGRWVQAAGWFGGLSRKSREAKTVTGDRTTDRVKPGDVSVTPGQLELAARDLSGGDLTLAAWQLETAARQGYCLPRRSPGLARAMSLLLPGSGQAYAGRPWNGLLSLAFNAAAGYLTVDAFRDDRHLDGALLLTLVWSRFYLGGLHNAGRHAEKFNRQRIEEHLKPYRPLMEPDYTD